MNLKITLPKNWNYKCEKSFINWYNRINEEVKKSKIKC